MIFTLNGDKIVIQCKKEGKMKDVCERYSRKININMNLLVFLYGGNQLNLELNFNEQATLLDKNNNEMNVLVYIKEEEFICPKCGEKIEINKEKLDEIIVSNNNIKDTINGIKIMIDNIIKNSSINLINIQLKNINIILNTINEDIKKNNEKLKNILNDNIIKVENKNITRDLIDIKRNKNNVSFNTNNNNINVNLNHKIINNDKELLKDQRKFAPVQMYSDNNKDFKVSENNDFSLMNEEFCPKKLVNYIDYYMRNDFTGKSEKTLNAIISIFKNINSKLVFQYEYEKKMSDRLLKGLSLSIKDEKKLISMLKRESGATFVIKMEEMINDLEKSKEEKEGYKLTKTRGTPGHIIFNVQVISQWAWDIKKEDMEKIEIPRFMKYYINDFENYYIGRHKEYKLIWCLGLSRVEIEYQYLKRKNISTSTLTQLLVLYLLEKYDDLNLLQIAKLLGCNVQKILYDIRGLIFNPSFNSREQIDKGVILADIDEKTKEFKETTKIQFNRIFTVTPQKFSTIPLPQNKTNDEIKASEIEEMLIIKRRQDWILQATLTRILKSRIGQPTTHVLLVNECLKQIDLFKAQPLQIKENIEKLIEKNVINRNGFSYEYIP